MLERCRRTQSGEVKAIRLLSAAPTSIIVDFRFFFGFDSQLHCATRSLMSSHTKLVCLLDGRIRSYT